MKNEFNIGGGGGCICGGGGGGFLIQEVKLGPGEGGPPIPDIVSGFAVPGMKLDLTNL